MSWPSEIRKRASGDLRHIALPHPQGKPDRGPETHIDNTDYTFLCDEKLLTSKDVEGRLAGYNLIYQQLMQGQAVEKEDLQSVAEKGKKLEETYWRVRRAIGCKNWQDPKTECTWVLTGCNAITQIIRY